MREGDTASYGHVGLHEYENHLRVCFEVLETREFENQNGDHTEQWHLEVSGYDREADEDVVTEEIVISIYEKNPDNIPALEDYDTSYGTLIWVAEEDPRRSVISATINREHTEEYPWQVNHDRKIADYSRYDSRETITSAILTLLEEIHTVF